MLHSICLQIWKTQQWPQDWKRSVSIPIPKKGNVKECSNYCAIALISYPSKVMLEILQARFQQYVNRELPHVQAGFRKGIWLQCRRPGVWSLGWEDPLEKEMATHSSILAWKIPWIDEPGRLYSPWGHKESDMTEWLTHTEKAEEPEIKLPTSAGSLKTQESSRKTSISALLTMPKPLTVWITTNCGKFWKTWEYQTTFPSSLEICMQVRKQQLEPDRLFKTGKAGLGRWEPAQWLYFWAFDSLPPLWWVRW